ncbi:MAG: cobalt-precorrin 5A hydrolase [Deltaproteobacteria bacterium]|nr:cobalt-precorrin 5A hydrolase [Deltaproteobacteria bacterium]MBW1956734.1 cobalt-precorrin 5A hydrolase [Deltaproteobacteria bacterium]MBW2042724.1 cobalt-precorrin 5A hydrolase [Deltaproteobacteria bacterium]MBW2133222.1 cobalt-precorrin 5A hydrolase [Deltaproteobacteria bacterium]
MTVSPKQTEKRAVAVWALTPPGLELARRIARYMPECRIFFSSRLSAKDLPGRSFSRLQEAVNKHFHNHAAHIFIMAAGIAVRTVAPLIRDKTRDPAVIVADEKGIHVISLLSGHLGGANALAERVAGMIGAAPVITTATDIHGLPAIDVWSREKGLVIENIEAVKVVHGALLAKAPIALRDPWGVFREDLKKAAVTVFEFSRAEMPLKADAGIFIDDVLLALSKNVLILRPPTLVAGIGCNRNTSMAEIQQVLSAVFQRFGLSERSLKEIATVDVKVGEKGLSELARKLFLPISFFSASELNAVKAIKSPSVRVERHIGAKSVCEAAAILGSNQGNLIVPKQKTQNVTVAVARVPFLSWESVREPSTI